MGACTVSLVKSTVFGDQRVNLVNISMSSSYATGGDTFTLAQLGLGQLDQLNLGEMPGGFTFEVVLSTKKIKAFWSPSPAAKAALPEVDNATDLHTITIEAQAIGV